MKPVIYIFYTLMLIGFGMFIFNDTITMNLFMIILVLTSVMFMSICFYILLTGNPQNHQNTNELNIKETNLLFLQLYNLIESSVKDDLNIVRMELVQIKGLVSNATTQLTDSFYEISSNTKEQQRLVNQIINTISLESNNKITLELDNLSRLINTNSSDAVRAFQFEDIVIQISDNSIQYIDNVEKFFTEFKQELEKQLSNKQSHSKIIEQINSFVSDLKLLRQQQKLLGRKAASQHDISEGEVELF